MINFEGLFQVASHSEPSIGGWQSKNQTTSLFGLDGSTTIRGGRTSRIVGVNIWLFGGYATANDIEEAIDATFHQNQGASAVLTIGDIGLKTCIFNGWSPTRPAFHSAKHNGFLAIGSLSFTQIEV